jgi:predicted RNase H-like HicB family nuclease
MLRYIQHADGGGVDKGLWGLVRAALVTDAAAAAWHRVLAKLRRVFRRFESERNDHQATWNLTVRVWEDHIDGGWVADCPDLPGCFSQGETREEALYNLSDAVAGIVSLRMEQQLSATPPESQDDGAEVFRVAVAS